MCKKVIGKTYLEVKLKDGQFDAPDSAAAGNGYEFHQARGVLIIDTKNSPEGDIGKVAVCPIAMSHVSSVHMIHEATVETPVKTVVKTRKGDEFGFFLFGGSDIVVLFEPGTKAHTQLIQNGKTYNHVGNLMTTGCLKTSSNFLTVAINCLKSLTTCLCLKLKNFRQR